MSVVGGRLGVMPELPEVTALAADLDRRLQGRVIDRLSIAAFSVAGHFLPTDKLGISLQLGLHFALCTLAVMLPLVVLLGCLQTLAAAFAKSFREAQTYLSLLMFVPAVPTMMLSLFPVKTQDWMYAVPLMGQHVAILRLLRGDAIGPSQFAMCIAGTTAAAIAVVAVTSWVYRSERLAISA